MAVGLLDKSAILNRGLNATTEASTPSKSDDVVGAFKLLVSAGNLSTSAPDLVSAVNSAKSPQDLASFFITTKVNASPEQAALLGTASGEIQSTAAGGFAKEFANGGIYWSPIGGTHVLSGPIAARWKALGGASGFLGNPTTDVMTGQDLESAGQFAHFTGGSLYYKALPVLLVSPVVANLGAAMKAESFAVPSQVAASATVDLHTGINSVTSLSNAPAKPVAESTAGCFEVHGAIREKYLAMGAEASVVGYPRSDETGTPDGVGRFNHFETGYIYWTPTTWAHETHGAIAATWIAQGAEKNTQLGYPLSDECVPDERIGHVHPENRKTPPVVFTPVVTHLPSAILQTSQSKVPISSAALKSATVATKPQSLGHEIEAQQSLATASASGQAALGTAVSSDAGKSIGSIIAGNFVLHIDTSSSSPAASPSKNRFSDFANGVLFWTQASGITSVLSPTLKTFDGTNLSLSAADVAAATLTKIGKGSFQANNVSVGTATFAGVADYSFDGLQTHNRRHRIQLTLVGQETVTKTIIFATTTVTQPAEASVELQVEIAFDYLKRRVTLAPVLWSFMHASSATYQATVEAALHNTLDPILWATYDLIDLPDTNDGSAYAVLSVKTLLNGVVAVYLEPRALGIVNIANTLGNAQSTVLHVNPVA